MRAVLVVLLGAVCDAYVIHNAPAVRPVASRALAPIMAAKKAKAKKSTGAGAKGGGFGTATAPKTVAEVCKTFKHRLPKDFTELCICRDKSEAGNAGTSYADCCRQLHIGEKNAETADIAREFGIDTVPSFVFLADGKVVDRYSGSDRVELMNHVLAFQKANGIRLPERGAKRRMSTSEAKEIARQARERAKAEGRKTGW